MVTYTRACELHFIQLLSSCKTLASLCKQTSNMERCFICNTEVIPSKRRRICSDASSHVIPLIKEWVETLPESPCTCLKCFGMMEKKIRLRRQMKEIESQFQAYFKNSGSTSRSSTCVTCSIAIQTEEVSETPSTNFKAAKKRLRSDHIASTLKRHAPYG